MPEQASTYTIGAVFTSPGMACSSAFTASVDYFNIDIKDPIIADPSVNIFVANCFNYYGKNPTYDPEPSGLPGDHPRGGDILALRASAAQTRSSRGSTAGKIHGSGMDFTINWGADLYAGILDLGLTLTHLYNSEQQERPGLPTLEYKGTASYFGSGLGLEPARTTGSCSAGATRSASS